MANSVEATGLIKIIKIPAGEAPNYIRAAWVGLELPCHPVLGYPGDKSMESGVLSGKTGQRGEYNRYGFSVPQDKALEILALRTPSAALWWRAMGFPEQNRFFGFAEDEAEIISGVTMQRIVEVRDEDQGDPDR